MKILLTNDDGFQAAGIHELRVALAEAGLEVLMVAPEVNHSGAARLATYGDPVHLRLASEDEWGPIYACGGTPVDCVRVGLLTEIAADTDLVVSGINFGCNLGDDILNSGTVGAASEAALLGVPALAVSEQTKVGSFHILDPHDTSERNAMRVAPLSAAVAREMLEMEHPCRVVLNLNFPAGDPVDVEVTHPARRLYALGSVEVDESTARPNGYRTYGTREGPSPEFEMSPGTDANAIRSGFVSISPISYEWDPSRERHPASWADVLAAKLRASVQQGMGAGNPAGSEARSEP